MKGTNKVVKLASLAIATAAAIVAPSWGGPSTKVVQAAGGTGCIVGTGCPLITPNVGITWVATWSCSYDTNGDYVGSSKSVCGPFLNGGCCNFLDTANKCPTTVGGCPSHS